MEKHETKIEEYQVDSSHGPMDVEHREQIIEDRGVENRLRIARITHLIGYVFGVIEVLIGLRVLLELIGANPANSFAQLIYRFSDLFVGAFKGLTITPAVGSIMLDLPALIAMLIYALVCWGITQLIWILFMRSEARRVSVYENRRDRA
jgi:hypothetical protein